MAEPDFAKVAWHRSSACDETNCVEVAVIGKTVLVRDTMDRTGKVLAFSNPEWDTFMRRLRNNVRADLLLSGHTK